MGKKIFKILIGLISLLILCASIYYAIWMIRNKPVAKRKQRPSLAPVVKTSKIVRANHQVIISALGTVIPAREIDLKARVSGELVYLSPEFMPGGIFSEGDIIAKIDDSDYLIAEKKMQASLQKALANLELERARKDIAIKQYEDFISSGGRVDNEDFVLRKPQERAAEADVATAQAALDSARLDLQRTTIRAPFNAVVRAISANLGEQISPQTTLAKLVDCSKFWIRAVIPKTDIRFIKLPDSNGNNSSKVEINTVNETIDGRLIRIYPDLDPEGQMARVLIEVKNPINLESKTSKIFLNKILEVKIYGAEFKDVFKIHKKAFREDNKIWLLTQEKSLKIIDTELIWRDKEWIIFNAEIPENSELIISDLPFVVEGMKLRTEDELIRTAPQQQNLQ